MVVAAAGAVEHAGDRRPRSSGALPASPDRRRRRRSRRASAAARGSSRAISSRCISRSRSQGLPVRDPALYSLQVFTSVLGGGMSSRLFQEVREKRGLCYSIYAFHMPYADTGLFGLYAGTDAGRRARTDARRGRPDRRRHRDAQRDRDRPRQGADEGRPADGAGKLGGARRANWRARCWPMAGRSRSRRSSPRSTP